MAGVRFSVERENWEWGPDLWRVVSKETTKSFDSRDLGSGEEQEGESSLQRTAQLPAFSASCCA